MLSTQLLYTPWEAPKPVRGALEATGVHLGPREDQFLGHGLEAVPSRPMQRCVALAKGR